MTNPFEDFKIEAKDPKHIHIAYGLMALGALALLKSPQKLAAIVGGVLLYQNLVEKGKIAL